MGRSVGRKILYEALKRSQERLAKGQAARNLHADETEKKRRTGNNAENSVADGDFASWPPQRRPVAAISGRVEFSLPYPMAAVAVLMLVLTCMAIFKVGQISGSNAEKAAASAIKADSAEVYDQDQVFGEEDQAAQGQARTEKKKEDVMLLGPVGDHIIIIAMCTKSRDLEPVRKYFAGYGIETVIDKRGGDYFLITKKAFQSPKKAGTDGYIALNRIKQLGTAYVAPEGYLGFGAVPFQDAYGDRIR